MSTNSEFEYDVCFSFAGEEREYVADVAQALQEAGIKVFYDAYEQIELWGSDLYTHLDEIYRQKARYCVMFISVNYERKVWTNHERKSAQARAIEDKGTYILPARFDDTPIPGILSTTGVIDLRNLSPDEFAKLVEQKVRLSALIQTGEQQKREPIDVKIGKTPIWKNWKKLYFYSDPSLTTEKDKANRRAVLGIVRQNWIERQRKTLWNEARLILNLEGRPDAVVHPCNLALRRAGLPDITIAPETPIFDVYLKEQGELLLLGEPGSGKTTLMLEIAKKLLDKAEIDPESPIPVVFLLSTWRKEHTRLDHWLVEQLNRDFNLNKATGKRWIENGRLLLLLDGLDEVAEDRRATCAEAINTYRQKHQEVICPMVVSCRTQEYNSIPKLRLSGAVVVQPLTKEMIDRYLSAGGEVLAGIRSVLEDESELYHELFSTPLMLNVAIMTYEGESADALRLHIPREERRQRIWDAYIDRMIMRKVEEKSQYEKSQALDWLAWLGKHLESKSSRLYLIKEMQPDDMPHLYQTILVRWLLAVTVFILVFCLYFPLFSDRVVPTLFWALPWLYIGHSRRIIQFPRRRFTWQHLRNHWKSIFVGFAIGAGAGAAVGGGVGAIYSTGAWLSGLIDGAAAGAVLGAGSGVIPTSVHAVLYEDDIIINGTIRPNEEILSMLKLSAHERQATKIGAVVVLMWCVGAKIIFNILSAIYHVAGPTGERPITAALIAVPFIAFPIVSGMLQGFRSGVGMVSWFVSILVVNFLTGTQQIMAMIYTFVLLFLLGALGIRGGNKATFQHYLLRFFLWQSRRFPYRITPFLDWATQRILVERIGGGWQFIHITLQERFAERYDEKYSTIDVPPYQET